METIWVEDEALEKALRRNQAFWDGELEEYPLLWVSAPEAKPGKPLPEPAKEEEVWLDVDYAVAAAENRLSRTCFAGDSLPFFDPWLGPDQFAGWLGADLTLKPSQWTSWVHPFIEDWDAHPEFRIDPENRWWRLYLATLRRSVEAGKGKWVTAFPDLHAGIDALSAMRGPENLLTDLLTNPEPIRRAMKQMTSLWKEVVDLVWDVLREGGQGTTNWTAGWSDKRFVCFGHNDFTCMIGPDMFDEFCREDTEICINYVDYALYHLDGPEALQHVPRLLEMESLHTVQWIHGDGKPAHSHWLDMLRQVQDAGKSVQAWYNLHYTTSVVDVFEEIEILCRALDPTRLFLGVDVASAEQADALLEHTRRVCRSLRPTQILT